MDKPPPAGDTYFIHRTKNLQIIAQQGGPNQAGSGGKVVSDHNNASSAAKTYTGVFGAESCAETTVLNRTTRNHTTSREEPGLVSSTASVTDTSYHTESDISHREVLVRSENGFLPLRDHQPAGFPPLRSAILEAEYVSRDTVLEPITGQPSDMASTPNAVCSSHGNVVLERAGDPPVEDEMGSHDIGEVITIVGRNHAQIDKMTMVVMAKSSLDRFLCLGLKCYARKKPNKAWTEKHALVVDTTSTNEPKTWEGCSTHVMSIEFKEENKTRLFDDCWINYEHLYTIREVDTIREGHVTNMPEIFQKFRKAQKVMWDRVEASFKPEETDY